MIVELKDGNIFNSGSQVLVNPVNTFGRMGKGLAEQFKHKFPANYGEYVHSCNRKQVQVGEVHTFCDRLYSGGLARPVWIANFPTKDHWKQPSNIRWIEDGLESLKDFMREHDLRSVAIPALGCGEGGLDWIEVQHVIKAAFSGCPEFLVEVFVP